MTKTIIEPKLELVDAIIRGIKSVGEPNLDDTIDAFVAVIHELFERESTVSVGRSTGFEGGGE
jgi:hypothetical protein